MELKFSSCCPVVVVNPPPEATVTEPDVAPLQVQGPKSPDVLSAVCADAGELARFGCAVTRVAGVDAVVSRTGWSRGMGFEIYPLSSDRATDLWQALEQAGAPHGMLVTGPNLSRAVEQGITDTHYAVNSGMDPFEAGSGAFVDLDAGPFVGRDALRRAAAAPARRHTLGLVAEDALPRMETFWPVTDETGDAGVVRWAAHSYALGSDIGIALLDARIGTGATVTIEHDAGTTAARVVDVPFVD